MSSSRSHNAIFQIGNLMSRGLVLWNCNKTAGRNDVTGQWFVASS